MPLNSPGSSMTVLSGKRAGVYPGTTKARSAVPLEHQLQLLRRVLAESAAEADVDLDETRSLGIDRVDEWLDRGKIGRRPIGREIRHLELDRLGERRARQQRE